MIVNDLLCTGCGTEERNVSHRSGAVPPCPFCGDCRTTLWDHGQAPATDMGEPQYNHGTGQYHRSHREAEQYMRRLGWDGGCGDKVGGARQETHLEEKAFSYAGQASRASTAEQAQSRAISAGTKHAVRRAQ